jgi:hypothetical protein
METSKEKTLKMGENVVFVQDYMVWGHNAKGMVGMFYRMESKGRCLVYLPEIGEWCEPNVSFVESKSKGRVPRKNKKFCSNVRTMVTTYKC